MGNAAIYYYPSPSAGLETIDIGEGIAGVLEADPVQMGGSATSLTHRFDSPLGSFLRVHIRHVFGSSGHSLYRELRSLENHLNRGGYCGIATNSTKAWAAFTIATCRRDQTTIKCKAPQFYNLTSAALASGDEVMIESSVPESHRETQTASSLTSNLLTLSAGLTFDYQETPILCRYDGFYPLLVLEGRQKLLTSPRRWDYVFEGTFRTVAKPLAFVDALGTVLPGTTPSTYPHKPNLEEVRRRVRGTDAWRKGGTGRGRE